MSEVSVPCSGRGKRSASGSQKWAAAGRWRSDGPHRSRSLIQAFTARWHAGRAHASVARVHKNPLADFAADRDGVEDTTTRTVRPDFADCPVTVSLTAPAHQTCTPRTDYYVHSQCHTCPRALSPMPSTRVTACQSPHLLLQPQPDQSPVRSVIRRLSISSRDIFWIPWASN